MRCQVWDVFAFSLSEEHEFRFTLHEFAKFPAFTNFFLPYQAGGDRRAPRERAQPVRAEKSRRKNQKFTLNGNRLLQLPLIFGKKNNVQAQANPGVSVGSMKPPWCWSPRCHPTVGPSNPHLSPLARL